MAVRAQIVGRMLKVTGCDDEHTAWLRKRGAARHQDGALCIDARRSQSFADTFGIVIGEQDAEQPRKQMGRRKHLPESVIADMKARYENGATIREIEKSSTVPASRVRTTLIDAGTKMRPSHESLKRGRRRPRPSFNIIGC